MNTIDIISSVNSVSCHTLTVNRVYAYSYIGNSHGSYGCYITATWATFALVGDDTFHHFYYKMRANQ